MFERRIKILHLQRQHVTRNKKLAGLQAWVIHESGRLADDHQELLEWLSCISDSGLKTVGTCSL